MKKYISILIAVIVLLPSQVFAVASSVDRITDHIEPLIKTDYIRAISFFATSTTATSTFNGVVNIGNYNGNGGLFIDPTSASHPFIVGSGSDGAAFVGGPLRVGTLTIPPFPNKFAVTGSATFGQNYISVVAPTNGVIIEGNVGIGTSTPQHDLVVNSSGPTTFTLNSSGTAGRNWDLISGETSLATIPGRFAIRDATTGVNAYRFVIDASGFVGIGTTSPIANLSVIGTTSNPISPIFVVASSSNAQYFNVLPNGNVGVGSTSPLATFSIKGNPGFMTLSIASSSNFVALEIEQNGNVGIGTTTAQGALTVQGSSTVATDKAFIVASTTAGLLLNVQVNGNVGIGSSTPGSKLVVSDGLAFGALSGNQGSTTPSMTIVKQNTGLGTNSDIETNRSALVIYNPNNSGQSQICFTIDGSTCIGGVRVDQLGSFNWEAAGNSGHFFWVSGVGTEHNAALFARNGNTNGWGIAINKTTAPQGSTVLDVVGQSTFNNFAGFGSTTPQYQLGVTGSSTQPTRPMFVVASSSNTIVLRADNNGVGVDHLIGITGTPTIATSTGAGAGGSATLTGNDSVGEISIVTSVLDTPSNNADIVTITFNKTWGAAPHCVVMPSNDTAYGLAFGVERYRQSDTTTAVFKLRSGTTPLTALTAATYLFNYSCSQ